MKWTWLVLLLLVVVGCDVHSGDDDDDDARGDGAVTRDAAVRDASSPTGRDGSVSLPDTGVGLPEEDGGDEDGGGPGRPTYACDPDNGGIALPAGFCAVVFAHDLGRARQLTVTPSGDVYVAIGNLPSENSTGDIAALRDSDGDFRADVVEHFGSGGGNGVQWRGGQLYFAQDDRVVRYALPDGELAPTAEPESIVLGLPATGDHYAKTLVLDGNDLYVNIGSATNSCQENNRQLESPGKDPCPELEERAGVWRFAADQLNQTPVDGARFVKGTRNLVALTLHPTDGALWAVQQGRDQLYENWPALYSKSDDMRLPSEELLRLEQGGDYGWPYCYHDELLGRMVLAPEYGGDAVMAGRCMDVEEPVTVYPAHWAALSIAFYTGTQFPARYRNGAFIAFHGSRFDPQAPTDMVPGYNVVFQPFLGGQPNGMFEEFASGFAGDARPLPDEAEHRPVGLAVMPDGSLLISDDVGGTVWRVFHTR